MSEMHGQFCWCELMTTDAEAAVAFYRGVVGWTAQDFGAPHAGYFIVSASGTGVGGVMALPEPMREGGASPFWMGYIGVDDVDAAAAAVVSGGGSVHRAPGEIEGVGRFAVVADPHGAVFTVFRPVGSDGGGGPGQAFGGTPGHVGWHELHAGEREAAFAFYSGLFGWTKTEAVDLGPMGVYQTFATGGASGAGMVGGMMTKLDALPAPVWFHYFNVDDIEAAAVRVREGGGAVLMGPHEVPGGSWIAQCRDPQGALFSVTGPRV